ncbi:HNH endonuclease [Azonexus hydrophilus]|uniref:HNH endonuclease n=1 Tax=Azonexus hydrophilus TaxID=418702 RepID=UPI0009DE364D|nr:HNH endonuclease [Azonexus hydrophilus]
MSSTIERLIDDAFAGLGSKSRLANGYRLQANGKQTVAVYLSGNESGNAVEIGLNPVALAPLLGADEPALRRWIAEQSAVTGRIRAQRGQRGGYPGVAFGNTQELRAFLAALTELRGAKAAGTIAAKPVESVRIEKAAQDAGFDRSVETDEQWMVFRSTAFPCAVGVASSSIGYAVVVSDANLARRVATEFGLEVSEVPAPWAVCLNGIADYPTLHLLFCRIPAVSRTLAGEGLKSFEESRRLPPDSTEAARLVTQRVGQDIFRASLLAYWGQRCAISGLAVPGLLRASHIKPWADCASDAERLDVYNGLLLAPHLDALFDGGWVTFMSTGQIQISGELDADSRARLGITGTETVHGLTERHQAYLAWHREHCFRLLTRNNP